MVRDGSVNCSHPISGYRHPMETRGMVAPVRITIPWGGLPTGNPWGPIFCPVVSAGTAMPLALPGMAGTDRFPARLPGCLTRNHGATEDLRGPDHMRAPHHARERAVRGPGSGWESGSGWRPGLMYRSISSILSSRNQLWPRYSERGCLEEYMDITDNDIQCHTY